MHDLESNKCGFQPAEFTSSASSSAALGFPATEMPASGCGAKTEHSQAPAEVCTLLMSSRCSGSQDAVEEIKIFNFASPVNSYMELK